MQKLTVSAPHMVKRQNQCFIIGSETLPEEIVNISNDLANKVTCDTSTTTIGGVPDVDSNGTKFSSINFADSDQSPLAFALQTFNTADTLANSNLDAFQDALNTYLATEAGLRSSGGSLAIKVPKFFLQFQMTRIQAAQGNPSDIPGMTVEHQLEKVLKNAAGEDQALLDEVNKLATTLQ